MDNLGVLGGLLLPQILGKTNIISVIISLLIMKPELTKTIYEFFIAKYKELFNKRTVTYKVVEKYSEANNAAQNYIDISQRYRVMYELLLEAIEKNYTNKNFTVYNEKYISFIYAENIKINDKIFINSYRKIEKYDKNVTYILTIELISDKLNYQELQEFAYNQNILYEEKERQKSLDKNKYIFICNTIPISTDSRIYRKMLHKTYKTFDNLFFEGKKELLKKIDYFNNNIDKYQKLGIPYTMGILLHGIPGSGKTSIIKAISNYCKRHVFVIPTQNIYNASQLINALTQSATVTTSPATDLDQRLYVFEEIDCGQWEDIVKSRNLEKSKFLEDNNIKSNSLELIVKNKPEEKVEDHKKLTLKLGEILEILDGMLEFPGRMIVFTTNRVEYLDDALIRPGRIDINLRLDKLNKLDVNSYYKLWFGTNIPHNIYKKMHDYKFTQAEIGLLFSSGDMDKIHDKFLE